MNFADLKDHWFTADALTSGAFLAALNTLTAVKYGVIKYVILLTYLNNFGFSAAKYEIIAEFSAKNIENNFLKH